MKQGWKVLYEYKDGTLTSVCYDLIYRQNEWTVPEKGWGPLAVFKNLRSAMNFAKDREFCGVHSCEYIPYHNYLHYNLWDGNYIQTGPFSFPLSTRLAQAVRILD